MRSICSLNRCGGAGGCLAGLMSLVCASALHATTFTWGGGNPFDAYWISAPNWTAFTSVPQSTDDVYFNYTGALRGQSEVLSQSVNSALITGSTQTAGNYVWHGGLSNASLSIAKALTLDNSVGATNFTINGSLTVNAASTSIGSSSTLNLSGATLNSTVNLATNGVLNINSGATFNGYLLNNGSNSIANINSGGVANSAFMDITSGGQINFLSGSSSTVGSRLYVLQGTATSSGSALSIGSGGSILVGSSGTFRPNDNFALSAGARINVVSGGDVIANSYADIGNGGAGTLGVDGVGSTFSALNQTDWGASSSGYATVTFSNSGVGTYAGLRIGNAGGSANVQLLSSSRLSTGSLIMGSTGAHTALSLSISGGTLSDNGTALFQNGASVSLASGGLELNGNATFSAGSTFNWSNGSLTTIGSGRNFTFSDGGVGTVSGGKALPAGLNLNVLNGSLFSSTSYIDIANSTGSGTLLVDGSNSRFITNTTVGSSVSDWGRNATDTATVTFSNSAVGTLGSGVNIAFNGGKALVNISSSAILNTPSLSVGSTSVGSSATINLSGGTLNNAGTAAFRNGSVVNLTSGGLLLGNTTFSSGANLNWSGGTLGIGSGKTLTFDGGAASISLYGALSPSASLNVVNGGHFDINTLYFIGTTGAGTLLVSGSGSRFNSMSTTLGIPIWADQIGNAASVTFDDHSVGTFSGGLALADYGGTANLTLLNAASLNIATSFETNFNGLGLTNFTINGGTLNSNGTANFGKGTTINLSAGGLNLYNDATLLTGATLNWTGGTLNIASGKTLTLSGGSISTNVSGGLTNGATLKIAAGGLFTSSSYYDLAGGGSGTLIVDGSNARINVGSYSLWASGTTNSATVMFANGGVGTYLSGLQIGDSGGKGTISIDTNSGLYVNQLTSGNSVIGQRVRFSVIGGTLSSSTTTLLKGTSVDYFSGTMTCGALSLKDNANISLYAAHDKVLRTTSLTMTDASQIDLTDNALIVDYTGTSPLSTIRGYLITGRNGGDWLGNALTSSAVANDISYKALGIGEASVVLGSGGGSFAGQSVDGTAVLVKYTYLGDANLDGKVDIADLGALATHYGQSSQLWTGGDFNYDGTVNIADLGALATNYGSGAASPLSLSFQQALAVVEAQSGVQLPEPGLGTLLAAVSVLARRSSGRRR